MGATMILLESVRPRSLMGEKSFVMGDSGAMDNSGVVDDSASQRA